MGYSKNKIKLGEFGVHKLWFSYDDERNHQCGIEDMFPPCLKVFSTFQEAEKYRLKLDANILRNLQLSIWGYRGETIFYSKKIRKFIKDKGWANLIEDEEIIGKIPNSASDQDLEEFIKLSGMDFHMVIEHKTSIQNYYVKLSENFWAPSILSDLF